MLQYPMDSLTSQGVHHRGTIVQTKEVIHIDR